MREQGVGLEHHVDRPQMRRHADHVLTVDQDAAAVRPLEARQQAQQGGLAAPRAAQQGEELATSDFEIDACHGLHRAEALGHAVDFNDRAVHRLNLAAGLDRGPQPRALAGLLGVGRGNGVEARAAVVRRIDPGFSEIDLSSSAVAGRLALA